LRSDRGPDLTLWKAELALKSICLATGRSSCGRGREPPSTRNGVLVIRCWQTGQECPIRQRCSVFKDPCALRRGREDYHHRVVTSTQ